MTQSINERVAKALGWKLAEPTEGELHPFECMHITGPYEEKEC